MADQAYREAQDLLYDRAEDVANGLIDVVDWYEVRNAIDYNGGWHEAIVDRHYSPAEAVEILEMYDEFEETDSGLWQGLDWRGMLSAVAAYTFSNACYASAEEQYGNLIDEFDDFVYNHLEPNGDPIPVDEDGEYLEDPWFDDAQEVAKWVQTKLQPM